MAKIIKCGRCGGTGSGSWATVHMGVPGLCYACDGSGQVVRFSMEERVASFVESCDRHLVQLEDEAARWKAAHAKREPSKVESVNASREYRLERQLESLRKTYRDVKAARDEAVRTGKVTKDQSPATLPSRFAKTCKKTCDAT